MTSSAPRDAVEHRGRRPGSHRHGCSGGSAPERGQQHHVRRRAGLLGQRRHALTRRRRTAAAWLRCERQFVGTAEPVGPGSSSGSGGFGHHRAPVVEVVGASGPPVGAAGTAGAKRLAAVRPGEVGEEHRASSRRPRRCGVRPAASRARRGPCGPSSIRSGASVAQVERRAELALRQHLQPQPAGTGRTVSDRSCCGPAGKQIVVNGRCGSPSASAQ